MMKTTQETYSKCAVYRAPISSFRRALTYLICLSINIQPVLANVVVSGGSTSVTQAGNGVEVVNIAAPNGKGLSHNQYQQFNVDKSGLILNNSTAQLAQSQLGGILQNNPNLTGQAASVILNEVTGATSSQLQGYTEVFGQQANVILANPYGITCDGCGFINTPRVTLSTGAPIFNGGEVTGFDVNQGAVTVEGLGLDASQQSYFDIISRSAEINAAIHAQDLTVVTGTNRVDYLTNQVTEKAVAAGNKPTLAIDSSSLGGMYAGRITLIATEDGVGVNVGNLAASQGEMVLTADGRIVLADASSQTSMTVSSSDAVELQGSQFANDAITVNANEVQLTNSQITSVGTVTLTANNSVTLAGEGASLTAENAIITTDTFDSEGSVRAKQDIEITAKQFSNKGGVKAKNNLTLKANELNNSGALYAGNDGKLLADKLTNTQNILVENDLLIAKNSAKEKSESVVNSSGTIESLNGDIEIAAKVVTNEMANVETNTVYEEDRRSTMPFGGASYFTAKKNSQYGPSITTETHCISGCGSQSSGSGTERTTVTIGNQNQSFLYAKSEETLVSHDRAATIKANGSLAIDSNTVTNKASQITATDININASNVDNRAFKFGKFATYYDYKLDLSNLVYMLQKIRKDQTLTGDELKASITALNDVNIVATNKVNNSIIQPKTAPGQLPISPSDEIEKVTLTEGNGVTFPEYHLPDNPNGLFVLSPKPDSGYLIETDPTLVDVDGFLGSDYFQKSLGFNPNTDVKFLGDAYYDTRVVTQAIFEQTGRRYLNESVGSDLEQMQQLMDSAANQSGALNLSTGIALTSEQVAALTENILWYEEVEINGETVLAPKLYLANLTENDLSQGASIAGNNVNIKAGELVNEGNIAAQNNLNVESQGELLNQGGRLLAKKDLTLKSDKTIENVAGEIAATGEVRITAKDDISNLSGRIQGNDVTVISQEGNITNKTLVEQHTFNRGGRKTSNAGTGNASLVLTEIGKQSDIRANGNLTLNAAKSIKVQAAKTSSHGDTSFVAKEGIDVSAVQDVKYSAVNRNKIAKQVDSIGSAIASGGALTMDAGNNINMTAATISAEDDLAINAGDNVTINTALNERYSYQSGGGKTEIIHSKTHQGSSLSGDKVTIDAGENLNVTGSAIAAKSSANLSAKKDVNILAVNDSQYSYFKEKRKKSWGRSKTTIAEQLNETVKGSEITAGDDITIQAQKVAGLLQAGGESDINLIGSTLNADKQVTLTADGDVNLAAQQYKQYQRNETIKKGFGGLSRRHKGSVKDATLLDSAYSLSGSNTTITSGNDIGVIASEVVSGGEVNLTAVDEVLISAANVLKQSQQWDEKTSFLSGGNLFEMDKKRQGEVSSSAQSSAITSGANLNINAGSIKVVGSELDAKNDANLHADTGDVQILAAKESRSEYSKEEKISIGLGESNKLISVDDGKIKISLGKATYDKVDEKIDQVNHRESQIKSGQHIAINSETDIAIKGSTLVADTSGDQVGDINLTAKNSIEITEEKSSRSKQKDEVHGKAEASIVVQHQAAEVVKAALALQKSEKQLKQAKKDYKQYKKQLSTLKSTLTQLESEYAQRKPGVLFEDVEELNDLISEVESDEAWYAAGIALAAADVASKTTLLVQQTAAAAQSSGTYGFNAGVQLDLEASKTGTSSLQTTSLASELSAENITLNAGNTEGDNALIKGARLLANNDLSIDANEVNILASTDTQDEKTKSESGAISASMTVYGASSGVNLSASLSRNESKSNATTHTNSVLSADDISIRSTQDTNIKGANIKAKEALTVNVGKDLNIASVQDRNSSSSKGMGISGGLSLSGSDTTGASGGINSSNSRTNNKNTIRTSLTSGNQATINVANNTDVKGALVATVDEQGKDLNNLNLTTDTLTYADLTNTDYNQSQSMGINTSIGINKGELDATNNSTNLQYKNTSGYSKSKTLATIGQGNLNITDTDNSDDTTALNRDVENSNKDLFTVDRKQGDFDVTVDHRLLSEDGRAQIGQDVEDTHEGIGDVADAAGSVVGDENIGVGDLFTVLGNNRKNTELKNDLTRDPKYAHIVEGLKSEDSAIYDKAAKDLYELANKKYGLDPSELTFYDATKTSSSSLADTEKRNVIGGVVVDENSEQYGKTYIDASEGSTKRDHIKGMGAELVEVQGLQQGQQSDSEATQEAISEHNSGHFTKRLDQALDGELSTSGTNFSTMFSNSSEVAAGTKAADKVGDQKVDHMAIPLLSPALTGAAGASGGTTTVTKNQLNDAANGVKATVDTVTDTVIGGIEFKPKFDDKELEPQIKVITGLLKDLEDDSRSAEFKIQTLQLLDNYDPKAVKLAKERAKAISPNTGGQQIPDPLPMPVGSDVKEKEVVALPNPLPEYIDSTTTTPIPEEQGATIFETPVDTGVDPLLVVDARKTDKLEVGKLESYKDSKNVTGDGSVHRDHQPSKAALLRRAEELKGSPLTPLEIKRIENNSLTVTVPTDVHKAGPTYGSKNTRERQETDANDLNKAASRDADTMVENSKELSPENTSVLEDACSKIKCITNDDYDDFLNDQLDD